jgi:hypothetical protein
LSTIDAIVALEGFSTAQCHELTEMVTPSEGTKKRAGAFRKLGFHYFELKNIRKIKILRLPTEPIHNQKKPR